MSNKKITFKKVNLIKKDDLLYDGKDIIIPGYWRETLYDALSKALDRNYDPNPKWKPEDINDLKLLRDFFAEVMEYDSQNYN